MPTTIIVESYEEFVARHGSNPVSLGSELLFPDGAAVSIENADIRQEPPTDPQRLLTAKRMYHVQALRNAELHFHEAREQFSQQAQWAARYANLPGPPTNAPQILQQLKAAVEKQREALAAIDEQLSNTPQAIHRREMEAIRERQQAASASLLHKINAIQL